jgi:hypothetical protein
VTKAGNYPLLKSSLLHFRENLDITHKDSKLHSRLSLQNDKSRNKDFLSGFCLSSC